MRQIKTARYQVISVLLLVLLSYLKVFWGFFQQDEWLSFAQRIVAMEGGLIGILRDSFAPSVGHFQPLNSLLLNALFYFFRISYFPYAAVSVALHLLNVYLIYRLAKNLLKETRGPIIISLLFGVSASIFQATSWVLADIGVHFSTLFALLSIHEFVIFLRNPKRASLAKIVAYLAVSLLFKEISIGLFLFYIFILFFSKQNLKKYALKLTAVFGFYVILRIGMFFMPASYSKDTLATSSQSPKIIVDNLITLPVKGFTQSIVPPSLLGEEAYLIAGYLPQRITGEPGTPAYDVFVRKKVLEGVTLFNSLIVFSLAIIAWRKGKNSLLSKVILAGTLFALFNSPVFALAPEREGRIFTVDSRNLYLICVGPSFVVYSLFALLYRKRKRLAWALLLTVIIFNVYGLNKALTGVSSDGVVRRNILEKIYLKNPYLPQKVIFYTESDSSYYGLSEKDKILPFQSGLGQTLLVWYWRRQNFPNKFYKDRFLWEITDQGYEEFDSRGFGYFRDFGLLTKAMEEFSVTPEAVISFRYDSETGRVYDNTQEVRGRLTGYFTAKKRVSGFRLSASSNPEEVGFAVDGRRETFWDSKLPYSRPQFIEFLLPKGLEVAHIGIDSYNNVNQNAVGYLVEVSEDRTNWQQVFFAERYPPDSEGYVNLYFKPRKAKFVRLSQVGSHDYAPWVIHELSLDAKN